MVHRKGVYHHGRKKLVTILNEMAEYLSIPDFSKRTLLGMCKAAIGQANINAQEMQNIGIYIPPIELQREFVQFKNQTDKSKLSL